MSFTLNPFSSVGWIDAVVSHYPKNFRVRVILCCEFLYTSRDMTSEFELFANSMDEIVTLRNI